MQINITNMILIFAFFSSSHQSEIKTWWRC